jgi:peroxiredoxin
MVRSLLIVGGLLATSTSAPAADPAGFRPLAIGDSAPDFKLPGVDDQEYTLESFAKSKLLLVIFTCNHCPTAQAYEERIKQLHADYKDKGVAVVCISPNDAAAVRLDELGYTDLGDSLADMKLRAKDQGFEFPYLYDGETQKTSLAYGVLATPHVYLFDEARKLRYTGRIDDSDVKAVTSHDARNAIDALLAGQPVPVEKTRVFGCSTKWSDKRSQAVESLAKWEAEPVTLETLDEAGVKALAENKTENYVLVNVWATWCAPCVAELPQFVEMNRMYRKRNFQLVTISIDDRAQRDAALKQLQSQRVAATNYISTVSTTDKLAELLDPEWPGPVPYTILIAPSGKVVYRAVNAIDPLEVKRAIVKEIGRTYANKR